ncbi:hypothetical protein K474DRAFT_1048579 [Panus rudis PR-1116 ss-1]|nr:hypothetical protein K474DRAFT_1048579 [Panus rudis PR-1116 ss-1]
MADQTAPPWPSLYNFLIEITPIQNRDPVQPGGKYLYHPGDIYRFTLYWTIVFYTPAFVLGGLYAFLNLTFPPSRPRPRSHRNQPVVANKADYAAVSTTDIPLQDLNRLSPDTGRNAKAAQPRAKINERRSRLTFSLLVLLFFLSFAIAGAVVGSAIIGYVLAGLFKVAKYNMSTWVPFFGGLLQASVGLLGLWPSVIDII